MSELDLYKFLQSNNVMCYRVDEWMGEKHYLIWIYYHGVETFIELMKRTGADFSEGHDVELQDGCIAIDLNDFCLDDIDLNKVFGEDEG